MVPRQRNSFVLLAIGGALFFVPLPAQPSTCDEFLKETLVLVPISMEIDGSSDPSWLETAKTFDLEVWGGTGFGDSHYFVSAPANGLFNDAYREGFHATATSAH